MKLAEKFSLPVFTFVDTPGAYPGIDAEERGQSGSHRPQSVRDGAAAHPDHRQRDRRGRLGRRARHRGGDAVLMLQYATYSVISPEGCASILWRSADQAPEAADVLGITAGRLKTLGLIDKIVPEPLGGAHRDPQATAQALRKALAEALKQLQEKKPKELVEQRLERVMAYGKFKETAER